MNEVQKQFQAVRELHRHTGAVAELRKIPRGWDVFDGTYVIERGFGLGSPKVGSSQTARDFDASLLDRKVGA